MIVSRLREGLTYANVVGTLALFIALGGVSYAAVKLPAHSVGTKQLKTDAVTSEKVRNGTLRKRDFKDGLLPRGKTGDDGQDGQPGDAGAPGDRGERGLPGAKGDTGPAGAKGDDGPEGTTGSPGHDGSPGLAGLPGPAGDDGATGPPGQAGPIGAQGPGGPAGMPGPTGIVTTARISGAIAITPPAADVWQFLGGQAVVSTTAGQRLTAAAMAPIAAALGAQTIKLDLCYQANGSGAALNPFSIGNWSFVTVTAIRVSQAVAGTIIPGAGTWRVGVCTQTILPLDNNENDYVNGYVQVTN
ncbi:MAG: hypothetical protein QOG56_2658 [Solirubrobacteraceae bacterium]|nr:hypothetical protein [Solirubrobacteraceae bacterium]